MTQLDVDDVMPQPIYSVSALMVYERCPFQYYTTFVRGIAPPRSAAREMGTGIHKLIADHVRQPALFLWDVKPELEEMLERFTSSRFNAQPILSEAPFEIDFPRGDVRGRIDLVIRRAEGGFEVVDFKSGAAHRPEEMRRDLQMPLYALGAARLLGASIAELTCSYFFLREAIEVRLVPTDLNVDAVVDRVTVVMEGIQSGRFDPPRRCGCHACRWERRWKSRTPSRLSVGTRSMPRHGRSGDSS